MFEFSLNNTTAKAVAALGKACSTDQARPILTGIYVEWDLSDNEVDVTFAATDGYILATRTLSENQVIEPDGDERGSVIVPAKEFAKALTECTKREHGVQPVLISVLEHSTVVSVNGGRTSFTMELIEGTFPNWRQLFPDEPVYEEYDGKFPALNPAYLKRVLDSGGPQKDRPVRFGFFNRTDSGLKPILFTDTSIDDGVWMGLQMPVRV